MAQYIAALIGLATTVLVSRRLGPEQFGFVALVTSYAALLWGFASFKAASVTTRYISGYQASGRLSELGAICKLGFAIDFFSAVVVLGIVATTAEPFAERFLGREFLTPYIVISALALPLYALTGTSRTIFLSMDRVRLAAVFLVIEKALILAMIWLALTYYQNGFGAVIVAQAAAQAVVGLSMLISAVIVLNGRGVSMRRSRLSAISDALQGIRRLFAWNYLLTTISSAMEQLPVLLLGRYDTASSAGFYRIATNLSVVFSYVESSLRKVAYPELSRRREALKDGDFLAYSATLGKKLGPAIAMLTAIAVLSIHWALPLFFGQRYAEAASIAQVLLVAAGVSGYFFWVESYYFALGAFRSWVVQYVATHSVGAVAMFVLSMQWHGGMLILFLALVASLTKIVFYISSSSTAKRLDWRGTP